MIEIPNQIPLHFKFFIFPLSVLINIFFVSLAPEGNVVFFALDFSSHVVCLWMVFGSEWVDDCFAVLSLTRVW